MRETKEEKNENIVVEDLKEDCIQKKKTKGLSKLFSNVQDAIKQATISVKEVIHTKAEQIKKEREETV